jgi:ribosomal protein S18 acetylase RimI-like enzyme
LEVDARVDQPRVKELLEVARSSGFAHLLTSALRPDEAPAFLRAGFTVREELHLLTHNTSQAARRLCATSARDIDRGLRRDRAAVLALDDRAFDEFWRLGPVGLEDALTATPTSRFRVARGGDELAAYAITGRAGDDGYVQRLAVDPAARRRGWGRALVGDALTWLAARGVRRTFVNTQRHNVAALALYEGSGFTRVPGGLEILERAL